MTILFKSRTCMEGFGGKDDQTNGITNLQEYLTNLKNELIEMIKNSASSVPTGLIAMFSGTTLQMVGHSVMVCLVDLIYWVDL